VIKSSLWFVLQAREKPRLGITGRAIIGSGLKRAKPEPI
jgi:hypothetical protein